MKWRLNQRDMYLAMDSAIYGQSTFSQGILHVYIRKEKSIVNDNNN